MLTFLALVYLARTLGVEGFGRISFAQAIIVYFALLTHLGLMTLGTREIARDHGQIRVQVGLILSLRIALTIFSFLLLVIFALLVRQATEVTVLIVLFGLTLFPASLILDWAFKGVERMEFVGLIEGIRSVFFIVPILLLVKRPSDIFRVPILLLVSTMLAALCLAFVFSKWHGRISLGINWRWWKSTLLQALPLGLAFMMVQVYYFTDTVMLGFMKGEAAVGWYSAGYKIILFIQGLGGLFFESTFPVVSRFYQQAPEKLQGMIEDSVRLSAMLVIPLAVGGTVLAKPLVETLYGPQYQNSVEPFRILLWSITVGIIGMNFGYSLMACNRDRQYMAAVLIGATANVILNLALIPRLSLIGAATAKLCTEILIFGFVFYGFMKVVRIRTARYLLRPLVASALMAAALLAFPGNLAEQIVLGMAVYFCVFFLISGDERADFQLFLQRLFSNEKSGESEMGGTAQEVSESVNSPCLPTGGSRHE